MQSGYELYLKEVGENVRRFRKKKGLTMEGLASKAEIELRQLGRVERGEVNPTLISLFKIADALEIDAYIFLMREKTKGN